MSPYKQSKHCNTAATVRRRAEIVNTWTPHGKSNCHHEHDVDGLVDHGVCGQGITPEVPISSAVTEKNPASEQESAGSSDGG
jgi:hypothetical protein